MDANNWRPTAPGGEPVMDTGDWRTQLQPDSWQRIVNKIMETLKRHLLFFGQEGLQELKKIAVQFEGNIYTAATNQSDYLRKISLKMLTMETKSQNTLQQQAQQSGSALLPNPGQQSHSQLPQQQLMAQIQSQPEQPQQQSNPLQRDLQQRLQASGSLLQQPNVIDQQKQLYQPQKALPETSSTSLDSTAETGHANGADWQEEIYQKIKVMKETYLPEINEMYQRIATKLQQHDPLPQQPKSEQLEKLKVFKVMLERLIQFLQVSKNNITPNFKEKVVFYEKQIVGFLNPSRYRKPIPNLQQGQLPQPHIQPMQQPQSQVLQLQSMNMQGSVPKMQQNNMSSLLRNSLSTLSGDLTSQSNMMNPIQPGSNLDSGQGNALSSLQQTPVGSVQQNLVSISQPTKVNTMSTQSGILQTQQLKRLQQRQNLMQNQQMQQQQQLHQQAPSPMPGDSDKPVSGISSLLNTGNIVHQPSVAQAPAPSLAIGTPGISASPLLADFTSPDGAHGGALTTVSGKSNVTEQPLEYLIEAVKSLSPKALSASGGDIGSVVSMIDRIAGSAAGNGSRAAAGEDLVAMTGCHLLSFLSFLFFTCFSQDGNSME